MKEYVIGFVVALVLVYLLKNTIHDALYGKMITPDQRPSSSGPNGVLPPGLANRDCPQIDCPPQKACPMIACPQVECPMVKCAAPAPCTAMNAKWYLDKYGDLKAAYGSDYSAAVNHFFRYGYGEGRFMSPQHEASGLPYSQFAGGLQC